MNEKKVLFKYYKETKGTHRYVEVDQNGEEKDRDKQIVGSLYLQKAQVGRTKPSEYLVVTIQAVQKRG